MLRFSVFQIVDACPHPDADVFITSVTGGINIEWRWRHSEGLMSMFSRTFLNSELDLLNVPTSQLLSECTKQMDDRK